MVRTRDASLSDASVLSVSLRRFVGPKLGFEFRCRVVDDVVRAVPHRDRPPVLRATRANRVPAASRKRTVNEADTGGVELRCDDHLVDVEVTTKRVVVSRVDAVGDNFVVAVLSEGPDPSVRSQRFRVSVPQDDSGSSSHTANLVGGHGLPDPG